jgi:hypothetical protein
LNHEGVLYQGLGKTIDFMLSEPPSSPGFDGARNVPHPDLTTGTDDAMGCPRDISTFTLEKRVDVQSGQGLSISSSQFKFSSNPMSISR